MKRNTPDQVRGDYDRIAVAYSEHLFRELDGKPFDRALLERFAREVDGGEVCEIGCGPGQVAAFLANLGVQVFGVDLSPGMVAEAQKLNPEIRFEVGDMMALDVASGSLAGVVAFYAIVNLTEEQIDMAFREMAKILRPEGRLLLAFHVGEEAVAPGQLWGSKVSMEFYFLRPEKIAKQLDAAGFAIQEILQREPYAPEVEHQSRRAYVLARKRK